MPSSPPLGRLGSHARSSAVPSRVAPSRCRARASARARCAPRSARTRAPPSSSSPTPSNERMSSSLVSITSGFWLFVLLLVVSYYHRGA